MSSLTLYTAGSTQVIGPFAGDGDAEFASLLLSSVADTAQLPLGTLLHLPVASPVLTETCQRAGFGPVEMPCTVPLCAGCHELR